MIVTLMLLAGVAGQIAGGQISDRYGRKEFMVLGLACSIPSFYLIYVSSGIIAMIAILLFGFALWSTFAVAVAMSHTLLPHNVGLASGIMLGLQSALEGSASRSTVSSPTSTRLLRRPAPSRYPLPERCC
jgi:FSR family fosmidomycin resistance protein-like MFS transporter